MSFIDQAVAKVLGSDNIPRDTLYTYKNRFALIGTVAAGKSTTCGGIVLTTQLLRALREGFFCRPIEKNSNILGDASNLRDGYFPEKTLGHQQYATEAGLLLGQKKRFGGWKMIQLPICDIAGEDLQTNIKQFRQKEHMTRSAEYSASANLVRYVQQSEGFLITSDASRAIIGKRGFQLNTERSRSLHRDPDVNLVRILNEIFAYKDKTRQDIKAIGIVITKWDEVGIRLEAKHALNILEPSKQDLIRFMNVAYPSVMQSVDAYQQTHPKTSIRFFPTYFEIERNSKGEPLYHNNDGVSRIVKQKDSDQWDDFRTPAFSQGAFTELIDWVLTFAV